MALWRDPLDELIADLERTLPPASQSAEIDWNACLIGCQLLVQAVTRGTPDDVRRIEQDPRVRAYCALLETSFPPEPLARDAHDNVDGRAQEPKTG